ncbi:HD domain-containing protein [uncultured Gammaproteobacteria bacterium]
MNGPPQNPHVALVIGSTMTRHALASAIRGYYTVSELDDGDAALKYFNENRPKIIVVDEMIAPYGGYNFVMALRGKELFLDIPAIIMSAFPVMDIRKEIVKCGANGYLPSPCTTRTVLGTISAVLNRSVERRWEALPETEKSALQGTISVINSIPGAISSGKPLNFGDVKKSCLPLVELVYQGNIKAVLEAVKEHDNYTFAHSFNVGIMLAMFGRAIGLNESDQQMLACGGLLHDIGKMAIPLEVLNKPGRLDAAEMKVMRTHVPTTMEFLEASGDVPKGALIIAAQHHEKIDGTGYPKGIKGRELNELARMAAIVDIYGALTDRRTYKAGMEPEKALGIMTEAVFANRMEISHP